MRKTYLLLACFVVSACGGGGVIADGCVSATTCQATVDCEAGYACNTALSQPACQTLGCGEAGTPCNTGALCLDGLRCVDNACVCTPQCAGRQCGDDGCGGICGDCAEGAPTGIASECVGGTCVVSSSPASRLVEIDGGSGATFGTSFVLSDHTVGFLGGGAPAMERFDGESMRFQEAATCESFLSAAFGAPLEIGPDRHAVVGGLTSYSLAATESQVSIQVPMVGDSLSRKIQVHDFKDGQCYGSLLDIGWAWPFVWRMNDGVAAVFGGIVVLDGSLSASADGLLCSYADFPPVKCQPYGQILAGPRAGHVGTCLSEASSGSFSCDAFLLLGGVPPAADTPLGDLMTIESRGRTSSVKPTPLAATPNGTEMEHVFGLQVIPSENDALWSVGGAPYLEDDLVFGRPEHGLVRYVVHRAEGTIDVTDASVVDLPAALTDSLKRVWHQVVLLNDSRGRTIALVVGGLDSNLRATSSVLVLEVAGEQVRFVAEVQLAHARFGHTATAFHHSILGNAVLVTGGSQFGQNGQESVAGSEVVIEPEGGW